MSDSPAWPNGAPQLGQRAELSREVEVDDIRKFTEMSGDRNPLHYDQAVARDSVFGEIIVQGVASLCGRHVFHAFRWWCLEDWCAVVLSADSGPLLALAGVLPSLDMHRVIAFVEPKLPELHDSVVVRQVRVHPL